MTKDLQSVCPITCSGPEKHQRHAPNHYNRYVNRRLENTWVFTKPANCFSFPTDRIDFCMSFRVDSVNLIKNYIGHDNRFREVHHVIGRNRLLKNLITV